MAFGLVCSVTMVAFEATAVATALPAIEADLGGIRYYGWVTAGFMLANLVGISLAGLSADRHGPATAYGRGLALFAVGLLAAGLAPSMLAVALARVVQGVGAGQVTACVYVGIGRGLRAPVQPKVLALLASAWIVPGLVGPAAAGSIAQHLSWRLVFLALVPLAAVPALTALPAMAHLGPPPTRRDRRRGDEPRAPGAATVGRALQLAVGVGVTIAGFDVRPLLVAPFVVVGGAAVAVDALRHGLVPEGTFRAAGMVQTAIALRFMQTVALFSVDVFLPLTVTRLQGASPTEAGLSLTSAALTWAGGSWLYARLAKRFARTNILAAGMATVAVGIAVAAGSFVAGVGISAAIVGWAFAGLGMGLSYSAVTLVVLECSSDAEQGRNSAALSLFDTLGIAVGTGLAGAGVAVADSAGWSPAAGLRPAFVIGGVATLGAILLARRLASLTHAIPTPG